MGLTKSNICKYFILKRDIEYFKRVFAETCTGQIFNILNDENEEFRQENTNCNSNPICTVRNAKETKLLHGNIYSKILLFCCFIEQYNGKVLYQTGVAQIAYTMFVSVNFFSNNFHSQNEQIVKLYFESNLFYNSCIDLEYLINYSYKL